MQNHKYSINYIIFLLNLQHLFGFFHSTYKQNQDFLILEQLKLSTILSHTYPSSYSPLMLPHLGSDLLCYYFTYFTSLELAIMPSTEWANRKQFISTFLQNCRLYNLSVLTISASMNLQIARSSYAINQKFPIK